VVPPRGRRRGRPQPRELPAYQRRRRRAAAQAPRAVGRQRGWRVQGGRDAAQDHGLLVQLQHHLHQVALVREERRQHSPSDSGHRRRGGGEELVAVRRGERLIIRRVGLVVGEVVRYAPVPREPPAPRQHPRRRPHGPARYYTSSSSSPSRLFWTPRARSITPSIAAAQSEAELRTKEEGYVHAALRPGRAERIGGWDLVSQFSDASNEAEIKVGVR
jgi:hypothetical protein